MDERSKLYKDIQRIHSKIMEDPKLYGPFFSERLDQLKVGLDKFTPAVLGDQENEYLEKVGGVLAAMETLMDELWDYSKLNPT